MTAAAKATALSFAGVALEVTPGTPVSASFFVPTTKFDPMDNQEWLDDLGFRNSMAQEYGEVQGVVASQIQMGGDVFADSIAWHLASIMGDVAVTGGSAPFSTTYALLNSGDGQPPSYTWWDFYGRTDSNPARKYAGCKTGALSLKASAEGLLQWEATVNGFGSAVAAKPSPSFTGVTPEPAWEGAVTIGGSSSAILEAFEVNLVRAGAGPIFNIDGTAAPYQIWSGKLGVSGTMTVILETDAELNRFVGAAAAPTPWVIDYTHGASAALVEVKTQMSTVQYVSPTKIERGKEYIELSITYKAVANATDVGASGGFSPCKFTTQNALASGTVK